MKTHSSRLATLVLGFGVIVCSASAPAEALVITSVVVTSDGVTYNAGNVGWSLPITLLPGEDLVLSQNFQGTSNSTTSYSFDTSDTGPTAPSIPQIAITADGVTTIFNDTNQVLNVKNQGSVSFDLNEAQDYGVALDGPGYQVFLGYADNVHPGACGAYASSLGLEGSPTCLPSPFLGATIFQARGAVNPGLVQTNPLHCDTGGCFDAGVIRIVVPGIGTRKGDGGGGDGGGGGGGGDPQSVPEPATMTLMLTGLAALIARRRDQIRKVCWTATVLD